MMIGSITTIKKHVYRQTTILCIGIINYKEGSGFSA